MSSIQQINPFCPQKTRSNRKCCSLSAVVTKTILVFALVALLFNEVSGLLSQQAPNHHCSRGLSPFVSPWTDKIPSLDEYRGKTFIPSKGTFDHPKAAGFLHQPGLVILDTIDHIPNLGAMGYFAPRGLEKHIQCATFVIDHIPEMRARIQEHLQKPKKSRAIDGLKVKTDNPNFPTEALYALDPTLVSNYTKAAKQMQLMMRELWTNASSASSLVRKTLDAHKFLAPISNPGKYRTWKQFVIEDKPIEEWRQHIKRNGGIQQDAATVRGVFDREFMNTTPEEEEALVRVGAHIAPPALEIPRRINELFAKMIQWNAQTQDPFNFEYLLAIACFFHREIVAIHPFGDGNGRMARAGFNAILQLGGYRPLFFPDRNAYAEAAQKSIKAPWIFGQFIRKVIIPWNKRHLGSNQLCLGLVTCNPQLNSQILQQLLSRT